MKKVRGLTVWSLIFTLIVLGLMFYLLKDVDFVFVWQLVKEIDSFYLGLAFVCQFLAFLVWNFRTRYSLKPILDIGFFYSLKIIFVGLFFNLVTPGAGIGGEPVRAHYIGKKYNKPKTKVLGAILADKFFNLIIQIFFTLLSLFFILFFVKTTDFVETIVEFSLFTLVFLIILTFILAYRRKSFELHLLFGFLYNFKFIRKRFKDRKEFNHYIRTGMGNILKLFKKVVKNKKIFIYGLFTSIVYWILFFLTSYFVFLSFGGEPNFISIAIVVTLSYLIGYASLIPGGIGLMEGVMFLLYSILGIYPALAILVALFSRIIFYFYGIVLGGIFTIYLEHKEGLFT